MVLSSPRFLYAEDGREITAGSVAGVPIIQPSRFSPVVLVFGSEFHVVCSGACTAARPGYRNVRHDQ